MAGDWYYAQGDQRLGPVSLAELRSYLQSGRIQRGTLVWTDGMSDWTAAGEVRAVSGADGPENLRVPMGPPTIGTPAAPVAPEPPAAPTMPLPSAGAPGSPVRAGGEPLPDAGRMIRLGAWPMIAIGLCLVVLAKGCDLLGHRQANYIDARSKYLQTWYADKLAALDMKYDEDKKADEENKDLTETQKSDRSIARDKDLKKAKEDLEKERVNTTLTHNAVARDFVPAERSMQYWRGILFALGTVVLIVGLVGAAAYAEGADRWVPLALLGILIYAIFAVNQAQLWQ